MYGLDACAMYKWLKTKKIHVFSYTFSHLLSAEDELQLSALHYSSFRGCPACHYSNRHHSVPEPLPVSSYLRRPATYHHQSGRGQRLGHCWAGWRLAHQHFYWPKLPWLQQQFPEIGRCADLLTPLSYGSWLRPQVSQRPGSRVIDQPSWRGCKALSTCRSTEDGLRDSEERAKQLGPGP